MNRDTLKQIMVDQRDVYLNNGVHKNPCYSLYIINFIVSDQ